MMMHVNDAPPSIFERTGVNVPLPAEQIALACLAKRPDDRPPDADAVIALIDAALTSGVAPAVEAKTEEDEVGLPPKRLPWGLAALTAGVAGVVVALALRPSPPTDAPAASSNVASQGEAPRPPADSSAAPAPSAPSAPPTALTATPPLAPLPSAPPQPPRRRAPQQGGTAPKKATPPSLDIRTER